MSKVVCDVCGTAFADTANQCPICGTAKSEATRSAGGTDEASSGYAYVRGGRFSQSNVRKHNSGKKELPRTTDQPKPQKAASEEPPKEKRQRKEKAPKPEEPENEQPSNIGLIIVVVILLLAIISLCAYIAVRYIQINEGRNPTDGSSSSSSSGILEEIPCTGITIDGVSVHTFNNMTDELLVSITCEPANTTDMVTWNYDNTIVKVIQSGGQWTICPVGPGETVVTVSCGAYSDTLTITSNAQPETKPTDPEPTEPTEPTEPEFVLELNREDFTMNSFGEKHNLYNGTVDASEITWYSDDETVCTIDKGVVTAVGPGTTNVYGVYGDQIVSCIVRCSATVVEPEQGEFYLAQQYNTGSPVSDVTISVGERLTFSIRASDGTKVTEGVTFYVSEEGFFTVDEKGVVTGVAPTVGTGKIIYLYAEYQGVVYECKVRVRNP